MRLLAAIVLCLSLSGCATIGGWFKPTPSVPPTAPAGVSLETNLGKSDGKVAAALTMARTHAARPDVVKAETGVALSFLPAPSADDLSVASARVALANPQTYTLAEADGQRLLAAVKADKERLKADQAAAVEAARKKDAQIADLTSQLADAEANANKTPLRVSAGLCFLAALGLAIAGQYPRAGVCVALGGILLGVSTILSSKLFIWSLIASALVVLGLGLWIAIDKARDEVNANHPLQ